MNDPKIDNKSPEVSITSNNSSSSSGEKESKIFKNFEKESPQFKKMEFFNNSKGEASITPPEEAENFSNFTVTNIRNLEIGVKLFAIFILMVFIWYFGTNSGKHVNEANFCLDDKGHNYLENLNHIIHKSKYLRRFFEISSSFAMDTVLLNIIITFFLYGRDGFPFTMIVLFYGPRGIIQNIFTFKFPKSGIWDYPGVPSLTVPYGLTCDFYFSGHCGFTAANVYYMWKIGRKKSAAYFTFVCCYLAFVLILFRIHYTIDIPIGVLYGVYSCRFSMKWYKGIERFLRKTIGKKIHQILDW